jgi:hypothetical protein
MAVKATFAPYAKLEPSRGPRGRRLREGRVVLDGHRQPVQRAEPLPARLAVDAAVILAPPCIFCMKNH